MEAVMWTRKCSTIQNPRLAVGRGLSSAALELCCDSCEHDLFHDLTKLCVFFSCINFLNTHV